MILQTTIKNEIQRLNILILFDLHQSVFFFSINFFFGIDIKIGGIKQIAIAVVPDSKKSM